MSCRLRVCMSTSRRAGGAGVIALAGQLLGDIDAKKLTALASAQILAIESRGTARTLATVPTVP
jgi:hypothetical protein